MELEPTYHLEGVLHSKDTLEDFEGPLTVILMLLSKNKIEIRDIPVAVILEQYLAYLDDMKAMDLEVASEFVQMASHLLLIKTKMLLSSEEEEIGELAQLIESLEKLKARDILSSVKEVIPQLQKASEFGSLYLTKEAEPLPGAKEYRYQHENWELLKAMSDVLIRGGKAAEEAEEMVRDVKRRIVPRRVLYNVREKSREILLRLSAGECVALWDFYAGSRSRSELVATFVSVLELCSKGHIVMEHRENEEIFLRYSGGDVAAALEEITDGTGNTENG